MGVINFEKSFANNGELSTVWAIDTLQV
jgi:hypothetical protein